MNCKTRISRCPDKAFFMVATRDLNSNIACYQLVSEETVWRHGQKPLEDAADLNVKTIEEHLKNSPQVSPNSSDK